MANLNAYTDEMLRLRRTIHRHPEEGWTEFETTALVIQTLEGLGYQVACGLDVINPDAVMGRNPALVEKGQKRALAAGVPAELIERMQGYTGAVAVLDTGRPGPTSAFRFDMDCVLVEESTSPEHVPAAQGFASEYPGFMHACGHDAHTATGLTLAHWLVDHQKELCGRIKLIFQPAEEGTRGGAAMAAAGVVDDVDWFFGAHVGAGCRLGEIGVIRRGFLATSKIDIFFKGTPSHAGSDPEKGHSALIAAAQCAVALQGIPRHGQGMTRVAIGTLNAGEGRNVTPVHAKMQIEVRGETHEINQYMVKKVDAIVKGTALANEVEGWWVKTGEAPNMVASDAASDLLEHTARGIVGVDKVRSFTQVSGSEDCSSLILRAQEHGANAGFFLYGCDQNGHHKADFEIQDTQTLPLALAMLTELVRQINKS